MAASSREAIILVGHGGVASDIPREKVSELKQLEAARQRSGAADMSDREAELDEEIRNWPRTTKTDPYKFGLEALAKHLAENVAPTRLVTAYNEFCGPSIDAAIDSLVAEGVERIRLVTTMLTPGGYHSEIEIPEFVEAARHRHPNCDIAYIWPYDLAALASFLKQHIDAN